MPERWYVYIIIMNLSELIMERGKRNRGVAAKTIHVLDELLELHFREYKEHHTLDLPASPQVTVTV